MLHIRLTLIGIKKTGWAPKLSAGPLEKNVKLCPSTGFTSYLPCIMTGFTSYLPCIMTVTLTELRWSLNHVL